MLFMPQDGDSLPLKLGEKITPLLDKNGVIKRISEDRLHSLVEPILAQIANMGPIAWAHVGSVATTGAGKDLDILVLVRHIGKSRCLDSWDDCLGVQNAPEYRSAPKFKAFRKGPINLLLTSDHADYERFIFAANICKALNIADKNQRVAVHESIRTTYVNDHKIPALSSIKSNVLTVGGLDDIW